MANVQREFSFRMAGKEVARGVLRAGNSFFFFHLYVLRERERALRTEKTNYVS